MLICIKICIVTWMCSVTFYLPQSITFSLFNCTKCFWMTSWNAFPQRIRLVITVVTMLVEGMFISTINFLLSIFTEKFKVTVLRKTFLLWFRLQFLLTFHLFVFYIFIVYYPSTLYIKIGHQLFLSKLSDPSLRTQALFRRHPL